LSQTGGRGKQVKSAEADFPLGTLKMVAVLLQGTKIFCHIYFLLNPGKRETRAATLASLIERLM